MAPSDSIEASLALRVLIVLLSGLLVGGMAATRFMGTAAAVTCPTEIWVGDDGANSRDDLTDGVDENNDWNAMGGGDFLRGNPCADQNINGQGGIDNVGGGSANDTVTGGAQSDQTFGGTGNDVQNGDAGDDIMDDDETSDFDQLNGGSDNDSIDVSDGDGNDTANGQAGSDTCFIDISPSRDVTSSCESIP